MSKLKLFIVLNLFLTSETAKILAVIPAPALSHQLFFRPLIEELVKRGHELTVITTDPAYSNTKPPANLTEIDVHDISYTVYKSVFCNNLRGKNDMHMQFRTLLDALTQVFEVQYTSEPIQNLMKENRRFDLVIIEAYYRITAVYAYIYKVPAVLVSSFGMSINNPEVIGAPVNPLYYPSVIRQRIVNMTLIEYISEIYNELWVHRQVYAHEEIENALLKKLIPDAPTIRDVLNNIYVMMLNEFPPWDWNRPVPPSVVFMGPVIQKSEKELPQDLRTYLDESKSGVIYISFGTTVIESLLPPQKMQIFYKVFSELPYNVIWKWASNKTQNVPKNVKLVKWLPQPELLKHPNVKLFITQGGIHSTYEAIRAEVPMIGIPISLDQWFQTEHYGHKGIGVRLPFDTITEEVLRNTILKIIEDDSYRRSISRLRSLTYDQPQPPLHRFVWWIEHVLRHGGRHFRAPAANMKWSEMLELELVGIVVVTTVVSGTLMMYSLVRLMKCVRTWFVK
ncbi:UDP-glucosyltransferase 2 [Manduca sexta]|uniref:UDP-glucosyltransferase 2 n=1 Tax=Manduca sexta TaxID=7130 RepID=UPI00188E0571|nr:UDP-glucosyltransferase 2 [Manduca sexta]